MVIHGREIKFRRTVFGNCEIAKICPGGDINNFNQVINGDYATAQTAAAVFIAALSEGYEMNEAYEHPDYTPRPLTKNEALLLDSEEFNALFAEAMAAFVEDGKTTVQTKEPKGKNASGDSE